MSTKLLFQLDFFFCLTQFDIIKNLIFCEIFVKFNINVSVFLSLIKMKYNVYTGEFSTKKHIGFRWLEFTVETQIYDGTESHVMYLIVDINF